MRLYDMLAESGESLRQLRALRSTLAGLRERARPGALADRINALEKQAAAIEGGQGAGRGGPDRTLSGLRGEMTALYGIVEGADLTPTSQVRAALIGLEQDFAALMAGWEALRTRDVAALDEALSAAGLPTIPRP